MKKLFLAVLVMGGITISNAQDYKVDNKATKIKWLGEKVTGEHTGFINIKDGMLKVEGGEIVGGKFTIDMTSITNTDIESEEYNNKLVNHLKSDDFFGVVKYPNATFVIKSVKAVEEDDATHHLTGDITIKGTTEEITFPAKVSMNGSQIEASSSIVLDRSKFDVRYGSKSFFDGLGDKVIYDDFTLDVNLIAKK